jgi:cyclopropane fatty-acyl-phospholipid synthase-like methyltransferase
MDSERLSGEYWDQVPHVELSEYASTENTKADVAARECFLAMNDRVLDLGRGWGRITASGICGRHHQHDAPDRDLIQTT